MIRSIGTWHNYKGAAHSFARFLQGAGIRDLRDTAAVEKGAVAYLAHKLAQARNEAQSIRTQETRTCALAAFERAFNTFFAQRNMSERLDFSAARQEYLALSREYLGTGRAYAGGTRAYPHTQSG